jgi:hypothetical protein
MSLLRRIGAVAASIALLAAMTVAVSAGPASANEDVTLCLFITSDSHQFVCALDTANGDPIVMGLMEGSGLVFSNTIGLYGHLAIPNDGNKCMQAFASEGYNDGWTVAFETCESLSGQYWKAVAGPVVQGFRTYYWANEWDPAYCLAWDEETGRLFADTCRNAWYQQFGLNVY